MYVTNELLKAFQYTIFVLGLSHEEVLSNLFLFLLAGYDTTSGTLSFLLYNLAVHPDIQEKLAQEIEDVVGDKVGWH